MARKVKFINGTRTEFTRNGEMEMRALSRGERSIKQELKNLIRAK